MYFRRVQDNELSAVLITLGCSITMIMSATKLLFSSIEVTRQTFYRSSLSYAIVNIKPIVPGRKSHSGNSIPGFILNCDVFRCSGNTKQTRTTYNGSRRFVYVALLLQSS